MSLVQIHVFCYRHAYNNSNAFNGTFIYCIFVLISCIGGGRITLVLARVAINIWKYEHFYLTLAFILPVAS